MDGRSAMAWHLPPEKVKHWSYPQVSVRALVVLVAITAGVVFLVNLVSDFAKELDPVNGFYSIKSGRDLTKGEPIYGIQSWRLFLMVEGDRVKVAEYWTCGEEVETFLSGHGRREPHRIIVNAHPSSLNDVPGILERRVNGDLVFQVRSEGGGVVEVEFQKDANAPTMFDSLGWH